MNVAGIDIGFRKTGITVFELTPATDKLIFAATVGTGFKPSKKPGKVAEDDINAVLNMLDDVDRVLKEWNIAAAFVEIPAGGGQSARAGRCMALATGWAAALMHYHPQIRYEFYKPSEVEHVLGIALSRAVAKSMGLTKKKGQLTKYKKERMRDVVLDEFPYFKGWPPTKEYAEDAYDSAAAFLCGRTKRVLYQLLKPATPRATQTMRRKIARALLSWDEEL